MVSMVRRKTITWNATEHRRSSGGGATLGWFCKDDKYIQAITKLGSDALRWFNQFHFSLAQVMTPKKPDYKNLGGSRFKCRQTTENGITFLFCSACVLFLLLTHTFPFCFTGSDGAWLLACVLLHSLPTPVARMGHGSLRDERVVAFSGEFSFQILRRICLVQQFKQEIDWKKCIT